MIRQFIIFIFIITGLQGQAFSDVRQTGRRAFAASTAVETRSVLPDILKLLESYPNHPVMHYLAARLHALQGDTDSAYSRLAAAVSLGYGLDMLGYPRDISNDAAFDGMRHSPRFRTILDRVDLLEQSVESGHTAFTVPDRDLQPEGIAYDPLTRCFFMGSTALEKIICIDASGESADLVPSGRDGLKCVLGMKVDALRRHLWACSVFDDGRPRTDATVEKGWTGIFQYDLNTGALFRQYILGQSRGRHEFNDLVLNSEGDVYVTDSMEGAIYRIHHDDDSLRLWLKSPRFVSPNGITFSRDEATLYMADWVLGIFSVALDSRSVAFVQSQSATCGIDGLYTVGSRLIAVQNGLDRVVSYQLDSAGRSILKTDILDANTPVMDMPTTGAVAQDRFYYIANLSLTDYHKRQGLTDAERRDVTVVGISLNESRGD